MPPAAVFPGSHLCHAAEYLVSNSGQTRHRLVRGLIRPQAMAKGFSRLARPSLVAIRTTTPAIPGRAPPATYGSTWVNASRLASPAALTARPRDRLPAAKASPKSAFWLHHRDHGWRRGRTAQDARAVRAAEFRRAHVPRHRIPAHKLCDNATSDGAGSTRAATSLATSPTLAFPDHARLPASYACNDWTSTAGTNTYGSTWVNANGGVSRGSDCTTKRAIACCE